MDRMVQTKKAQVWVKKAVVFVKKITSSQWHVLKDLEGTSCYMRSEIDDLHLEKSLRSWKNAGYVAYLPKDTQRVYAAQWKGDNSAFLEVKWRHQKVAQIEQHDYLVATLRSVNRADDVDAISEVYPIGVNEFLDNWSQFFSTSTSQMWVVQKKGFLQRSATQKSLAEEPSAWMNFKGGLRSIAIGEVLRRLTGKCLMECEHFFPAQIETHLKFHERTQPPTHVFSHFQWWVSPWKNGETRKPTKSHQPMKNDIKNAS